MANVNHFDLKQVIGVISKVAPPLLIICALGSFAGVTIFLTDYYQELFKPRFEDSAVKMAVMVAVIQELVRFCLLVSSVRDFSQKKPFTGWLGLLGSSYLVYHDISVANELSASWGGDPLRGVLLFLIIVGLILEIRLVLTVGTSGRTPTDRPTEESDPPKITHQPKKKKKKKSRTKKSLLSAHHNGTIPNGISQ